MKFQLSGTFKKIGFGALIALVGLAPFSPRVVGKQVGEIVGDSIRVHRRENMAELREINDKLDRLLCWMDPAKRATPACVVMGFQHPQWSEPGEP